MASFFRRKRQPERDILPLSWSDYLTQFTYAGNIYPLLNQTLQGTEEQVTGNFEGLVRGAYKSNGPVFACILVRMLLFSEARFAFRRIEDGRPGELFAGTDGRNPGNRDLQLLANPWPNATTGDMLSRALVDADLAGNSFWIREGRRIRRLRPDWMTIVYTKSADEYDAEVAGYMYQPGGPLRNKDPIPLLADQVAHFAPIPDPVSPVRGMSWLNPVISEIEADLQATTHKKRFFTNGATPNMVITGLPQTKEQFDRWVSLFKEKHAGAENAYNDLFLSGAVDVKVVGADFKQLDFKMTQGAGETRIAAAAGVPPVIVGLSEGLQAATYSNYSQARRRFADGTMRPLWRNLAGSFAKLVSVPDNAELWYDDRDIPFLQEDRQDAAQIQSLQAQTIKALTDAGFEPDAVVEAVTAGDLARLRKEHTGLFSVQLQPPGTVAEPPATTPQNGSGKPNQLVPATTGDQ